MVVHKRLLLALCVICMMLGVFAITAAQDNTVITIAVPEGLQQFFAPALQRFQTENPGIQVKMVIATPLSTPPANPTTNLDEYLQSGAASAQSADVLFKSRYDLSPELTRA